MKKINFVSYSFFSLLLVLLLVFPSLSIEAGKQGLLLWFNVIIPTLFPFMIISYIILHSPIIDFIIKLLNPLFNHVFKLSGATSYALIIGILSGYPMGGVIVSDLVQSKRISKNEGNYVLTFCNNPSPMFIIGFVATALLNNPKLGLPILLSIYCGNFITAILFKKSFEIMSSHNTSIPNSYPNFSFASFDECLAQTAKVLLKVGGYIIFFSIPITLLSKLNIHHLGFKFLISTIDLSNGVNLIANAPCSDLLKYALLAALSAFGSLSVVGQTASVIKGSGLSIIRYFFSKIVVGLFAFISAVFIFRMKFFM